MDQVKASSGDHFLASNTYQIESRLEKIGRRYNPEFDVPQDGQPPVTWGESDLMQAISLLLARVQFLEIELTNTRMSLEDRINDMANKVRSDDSQ